VYSLWDIFIGEYQGEAENSQKRCIKEAQKGNQIL
jgi:hypothetical protein